MLRRLPKRLAHGPLDDLDRKGVDVCVGRAEVVAAKICNACGFDHGAVAHAIKCTCGFLSKCVVCPRCRANKTRRANEQAMVHVGATAAEQSLGLVVGSVVVLGGAGLVLGFLFGRWLAAFMGANSDLRMILVGTSSAAGLLVGVEFATGSKGGSQ